MKSDAERGAEYEQFKKIDSAVCLGDLAALRAAVDDPDCVPNGPMPLAIGPASSTRSTTGRCRSSALCSRSARIPTRHITPDFRP